jgi:hypothetical protein
MVKGQIMQELTDYVEKFGFYCRHNGRIVKGYNQAVIVSA